MSILSLLGAPRDRLVYWESFEAGTGGWLDALDVPPTLTTDLTSPEPPTVMEVARAGIGGDYWSPAISVSAGISYRLTVDLRWLGGACPFVGLAVNTPSNITWLIGRASEVYDVQYEVVDNLLWQRAVVLFTVPSGAISMQIVAENYAGVVKPGDTLVYYDGFKLERIS